MGRTSSGAWYQDVRRVAEALDDGVTGPRLTTALMQDRSTLSLPMARRLSSAFLFAASKTDDVVLASIAVCEQVQAIQRLDPAAASGILGPALAGEVPLSALQAQAASIRARLSATSADATTSAALAELCPEWQESGLREQDIEYDQIRDRDRVVVDAAVYAIHLVERASRHTIDYDGRWCMLVSPHIACAKNGDASHDRFIGRILVALALYARVSVICSSAYELGMLERELRRPRVWNRIWLHYIGDKAGREV